MHAPRVHARWVHVPIGSGAVARWIRCNRKSCHEEMGGAPLSSSNLLIKAPREPPRGGPLLQASVSPSAHLTPPRCRR